MDESHDELVILYSLDLLEGAEKTRFETQMATDAALRAQVEEYRELSAQLAYTAPQLDPPAGLKEQLLREISAPSARRVPAKIISFPVWLPWAAAACFALTTIWFEVLFQRARSQANVEAAEASLAQAALRLAENQRDSERIVSRQQLAAIASARQEVAMLDQRLRTEANLAELKISTLSSLLKNSPQAQAVAVWNPAQQQGVFTAQKLAAPPEESDYELWIFDGSNPKPVAAGIFAVGTNGVAHAVFRPENSVSSAAKFAVTRERKGGVPAQSGPKGPVVLVSQ